MADVTPLFEIPYQEHDDPPAGHTMGKDIAEKSETLFKQAGAQAFVKYVSAEQTVTNTSPTAMGTPDSIHGVVIGSDHAIVEIGFLALVKETVDAAGNIRLTLNTGVVAQSDGFDKAANVYGRAVLDPRGLIATGAPGTNGAADSISVAGSVLNLSNASRGGTHGGTMKVWVPSGTHDFDILYSSSSGSVLAKERRLWVKVHEFEAV